VIAIALSPTLDRKNLGVTEPMPSKPGFKIRVNGIYMPEINVRRGPDGGNELTVKDREFGWIVVDDRPDLILEYRDETAWACLRRV